MNNEILSMHIELVERVNNSKTARELNDACNVLHGFRKALDAVGIDQLIACDLHYLNQGIDRPMCAGVFLDLNLTTEE